MMQIVTFRNIKPASTTNTFDEKLQATQLASTTQENSTEEVTVTTFHDVETPQVSIIPSVQQTSSISHMDSTVSIVQFLQRPVKLDHFQLKYGDEVVPIKDIVTTTPQPRVRSWQLPGDILKRGGKLQKVMNHQYFKADVHVKVVINTNPFVAGRFYLTYSPYEKQIVERRRLEYASRAGVTAYPGVEIDVQLDNSVEMIVPFASYKEAYVLTEKDEDYVQLYLLALTPVLGTKDGQGVVDMAIYAWFENVQINLPTLKTPMALNYNEIATASLSQKDLQRLQTSRKLEKLEKKNPSVYNYIMQYLKPEKVEVSMQVQAEAGPGPIGSIASTIGSVAGAVSGVVKDIPIVGEIAGGIKWVSDIVGTIANIFGWSRPNSYSEVKTFQNVPGKFYTHTEALDQSVALALSNKNELDKPMNIFPSSIDEMDLTYVCANPSVKHIFTWSVLTPAGEIFTTKPIGLIPVGIGSFTAHSLPQGSDVETRTSQYDPLDAKCSDLVRFKQIIDCRAFKRDASALNPSYFPANLKAKGKIQTFILDTAPCEYVSQLFQSWRATLCFKISVVKTAFHTGRLEIFFDPGMYHNNNDDFITPNLEYYKMVDTTNNYKYILDLTNDSEITIKIPFVSERLFKSTKGLNGGVSMPTIKDVSDSIIGSLILRPVSNLLAPPNVEQSVRVVVWKWAEDVVLGAPVAAANNNMRIYDKNIIPSIPDIEMKQIDNSIVRDLPYIQPIQKIKREVDFQINISNKAEGNVVTFFETVNIEEENMLACKNALGERIVNLRPLLRVFRTFKASEPMTEDGITYSVQDEAQGDAIDYLNYLSYMYRFFRGGVRYKLFSKFPARTLLYSRIHPGAKPGTEMTPSHLTYTDLNPVHEVSIPFYSQYRKLPISVGDNILNCTFIGSSGPEYQYLVMRSGNDDLTYAWLMGTPQLMPGNASIKWESYSKVSDGEESTPGCPDVSCKTVEMQINRDIPDSYDDIPDPPPDENELPYLGPCERDDETREIISKEALLFGWNSLVETFLKLDDPGKNRLENGIDWCKFCYFWNSIFCAYNYEIRIRNQENRVKFREDYDNYWTYWVYFKKIFNRFIEEGPQDTPASNIWNLLYWAGKCQHALIAARLRELDFQHFRQHCVVRMSQFKYGDPHTNLLDCPNRDLHFQPTNCS